MESLLFRHFSSTRNGVNRTVDDRQGWSSLQHTAPCRYTIDQWGHTLSHDTSRQPDKLSSLPKELYAPTITNWSAGFWVSRCNHTAPKSIANGMAESAEGWRYMSLTKCINWWWGKGWQYIRTGCQNYEQLQGAYPCARSLQLENLISRSQDAISVTELTGNRTRWLRTRNYEGNWTAEVRSRVVYLARRTRELKRREQARRTRG